MGKIKSFLKKLLPPPVKAFMREVNNILSAINRGKNELRAQIEKLQKEHAAQMEKLIKENTSMQAKLTVQNEELKRMYQLFESANRENLRIFLESKEERENLLAETKKERQQLISEYTNRMERYSALLEAAEEKNARLTALLEEAEKKASELLAQTERSILENRTMLSDLQSGQAAIANGLSEQNDLISQVQTSYIQGSDSIVKSLNDVRNQANKASRSASETVWAEIFNNAISDSKWLKSKAFSPGRWAVGYPYLYVMYRVLNEFKPKSILELGLGQTTRMIAQYTEANPDVIHYVVEHDSEWIGFFKNNFMLPENTEIIQLDREMIKYKEAEEVRVFKGFSDRFKNMKFDYICIDAPLGGDMKHYSRIDILSILPDCLESSFVITLDDYNRKAEQNTGREIETLLKERSIDFRVGSYFGEKDFRLWCSPDVAFLSSL